MSVGYHKTEFKPAPHRFEAGTPDISGPIGLHAAMDYLDAIGRENIWRHDQELAQYAYEELSRLKDIRLFGPKLHSDKRAGLVSDLRPSDDLEVVRCHSIPETACQIVSGQNRTYFPPFSSWTFPRDFSARSPSSDSARGFRFSRFFRSSHTPSWLCCQRRNDGRTCNPSPAVGGAGVLARTRIAATRRSLVDHIRYTLRGHRRPRLARLRSVTVIVHLRGDCSERRSRRA